jgi:hypothetical protein
LVAIRFFPQHDTEWKTKNPNPKDEEKKKEATTIDNKQGKNDAPAAPVTSTRTGSFAIADCSRTTTKHKKKKKTQQQKYQPKVLRIRSILCATNEESSRLLWASKYHEEEEEEETKMYRGPRTLMECRKEHTGKMPLWKPLLQSLLCSGSAERLGQKMMMCEVFPSAFVLIILRLLQNRKER